MSDNPFSEPSDNDRTVIRPVPGGRRTAPGAAAPAALQPAAALPPVDLSLPPAISVSPLTVAASPLLQLLSRLRAVQRPLDVRVLRERAVQDLSTFERRARETGIAMELLRPAHYALCAAIDDVVVNTPWGAASGWPAQTLVATYHHGARGTGQFFDQLRQMLQTPDKFVPVIELMYLCLCFGFMGRYRQARGEGELEQIRVAAHAAIVAQRKAPEPELSWRWRGIEAPYRPRRPGLPIWVALAGSVAACGGLLFWTSSSLNAASDRLLGQALATPPSHLPQIMRAAVVQPLPPPPAPAEPTVLDSLRASLQPDIDQHTVSLLGTPATPVIRIADRGMFASTSAAVQRASLPLLERIATALRDHTGALSVVAYTDNEPIRTVKFPSNFQLSAARANAVRAILVRLIGDPKRISAEGRADTDPIAPNTTPEGRAQNRRVEIVLHRQD